MYVLSVETATKAGSLALLDGNDVLTTITSDQTASHSANLLKDVELMLKEMQVGKNEIGLLAAAIGPGSFTGLRIGLATIKGLAKALRIPAIGISILEAAVFAAGQNGLNCAIFPAGRGEVFAQNFSLRENQFINLETDPYSAILEVVIEKNSVFENLRWISPNDKLPEIKLAAHQRLNWSFSIFPENLAQYVGQMAFEKYQENLHTNSVLTPLYVRNADVG